MSTIRRRVTLALAGVGVVAATVIAAGPAAARLVPAASSSTISVGVVAPFTGPAAEFGQLLSVPCYVGTALINRAGGVLGSTLKCVPVDDTGDPADAVPNVTKAIATTSNFQMAIGLETNTAATTIPLLSRAKIPFFTTNGLVSYNHTTDPYFWRATPADNANGAAFVAFAAHRGWRRIAVIFENTASNEANLPGVMAAIPKENARAVINLSIPGDSSSYSSVVERVLAAHPQVLIFSADPQTTATFLSEYQQLNHNSVPPMITATESLTPDFYDTVSKVIGTSYITHHLYLVGAYFSTRSVAYKVYAKEAYANPLTHKLASTILAVGPPASAYDGLNIMALAMLMAHSTKGSVYDRYITQVVSKKPGAVVVQSFAAGKRALAAGRKIQYEGVVGAITFNRYHNFAGSFAVNVFRPSKAGVLVYVIPGAEVSRLLG